MKKLVFIWSPAWSGSTMLDAMIGSGEDAFACGEIYALWGIVDRGWGRQRGIPAKKIFCSHGEYKCSILIDIQNAGSKRVYDCIFSKFKQVNVISDSSKTSSWFKPQLKWQKGKYEIYNILIYKHPMNWIYSQYKRLLAKPLNPYPSFLHYLKNFLSLEPQLENVLIVSFEKLIQNPAEMLKKICEQIGIRYFAGKEKFWNFNHHMVGGGIMVAHSISKYGSKRHNTLANRLSENRGRKVIKQGFTHDDWETNLPPDYAKCLTDQCKRDKIDMDRIYAQLEERCLKL